MTSSEAATGAESFDAFYSREIAPALAELEGERRKAVLHHNIAVGVGAALAVLVVIVFGRDSGFSLIGAAVVGFGGVGIGQAILGAARARVKDALTTRLAAFAGVTFQHQVADPSSLRNFRKHRLIPHYDRSSFEDRITGERAGRSFELYEAHLQARHTDSKGRTHYTTCFRGQVMAVVAPMKFLGVTVVWRDAGMFNALAGVGSGLKRVGLVDPKFEKIFEVFGSDQVEARYLLTPTFMERLLALETMLKGKKARAAFADGELLIAVEGGDLFEAGSMFAPLADPARAKRVLDDIEVVQGIVDTLMETKLPPEQSDDGDAAGS